MGKPGKALLKKTFFKKHSSKNLNPKINKSKKSLLRAHIRAYPHTRGRLEITKPHNWGISNVAQY